MLTFGGIYSYIVKHWNFTTRQGLRRQSRLSGSSHANFAINYYKQDVLEVVMTFGNVQTSIIK